MACSKYEYVKNFENQEALLPNCYIVVRIDGKGFHRFTTIHGYEKPNDKRGIDLMNKAAEKTMLMFQDIFIAYGQSDEYSFVFHKQSKLFKRRSDKIHSTVVSCFTSNFVFHFKEFFPEQDLLEPPVFDSRCVLYPTVQNLRDYISWRQVDCHINNLYNTCFWYLVEKKGMTKTDAQNLLKDTDSAAKNELLFNDFGINYNNLPEQFKKGNTLIKAKQEKQPKKVQEQEQQEENIEKQVEDQLQISEQQQGQKEKKVKLELCVLTLYCDIIKDDFWKKYEKELKNKLY